MIPVFDDSKYNFKYLEILRVVELTMLEGGIARDNGGVLSPTAQKTLMWWYRHKGQESWTLVLYWSKRKA